MLRFKLSVLSVSVIKSPENSAYQSKNECYYKEDISLALNLV
jgi:hypothetical protein